MQSLAYILSALGLISMLISSLIKGERMKTILFLVFCGNVLVATSYLVEGKGMNGAAACYLGGVQTLINYIFLSKNKPIPKWLISIYVVAIIALNIWVAGGISALGLLVIVASLMFIVCISQKNGTKYRLWTIVNIGLWCIYDVLSMSYSALVTHLPQLLVAVTGVIIYDSKCAIKKK